MSSFRETHLQLAGLLIESCGEFFSHTEGYEIGHGRIGYSNGLSARS